MKAFYSKIMQIKKNILLPNKDGTWEAQALLNMIEYRNLKK